MTFFTLSLVKGFVVSMKISIAGTGYVGLSTAVMLAEIGYTVTCVDVDPEKIEILKKGILPIYEPGLDELLIKNINKIVFTTDYSNAYKDADIIIVCIGTPEKKDGSTNLKYVFDVAEQIASTVEKDCIIVVKSTVPIGTNDKIEKFIKSRLRNRVNICIASNPEFLSQGNAVNDTLHASRIIIGVESSQVADTLKEVYSGFNVPIFITNRRSAELIKYASNNFLALKISYINEIANLCEIVGANIDDVSTGMSMDKRIGNTYLKAGIGYGGSCFPKDTKALSWFANFNGYELKTVKATIEVNEQQKLKLIKKSKKYYDSFQGLTVAILGLTFKPETDDLREAPSLITISMLLDDGAIIKAWDSVGINNAKEKFGNKIKYCDTIEESLLNAEICFIFTEWREIKELTANKFISLMKKPIVLDGRNCFDLSTLAESGVIYESIGRESLTLTHFDIH